MYLNQLASLFTRKGIELAEALRAIGYLLVEVKGQLVDGEMTILYVEIPRRQAQKLVRDASAVDERCFCIVNDVRIARFASPGTTSAKVTRLQAS